MADHSTDADEDAAPGPLVTVVLCARNSASTIGTQLAALARQTIDEPFEVIVVDNDSSDETATIATVWTDRLPLRVLSEPVRGVNRARNRGVRSSRSELIAMCDSDDEVDEHWLRALCIALERHDIVGGRIEHHRLSDSRAAFRDEPQSHGLSSAMGVPYSMGANLGFRRRVFDVIGGFDPAFDIGCDDVDFCLRAHHAGFPVHFAGEAVVHYRNKHRLGDVARQRFSYGRGDERLARRHGRLGYSSYRVSQRLKVVVVRIVRNLERTGDVLRPTKRAGLVGTWAFVAGLAFELVADHLHDVGTCPTAGDSTRDARNASKR